MKLQTIGDTENIIIGIIMLVFSASINFAGVPAIYQRLKLKPPRRLRWLKNLMAFFFAVIISPGLFFFANLGATTPNFLANMRLVDEAMLGEPIGAESNSIVISGSVSVTTGQLTATILLINPSDKEIILKPSVGPFPELAMGIHAENTSENIPMNNIHITVKEWEGGGPIIRVGAEGSVWINIEIGSNPNIVTVLNKIRESYSSELSSQHVGLKFEIPFQDVIGRYSWARGNGIVELEE